MTEVTLVHAEERSYRLLTQLDLPGTYPLRVYVRRT